MKNKKQDLSFIQKKGLMVLLQILVVLLQIGLIVWLYTISPINRIIAIISYMIFAPLITWLLKKISPSKEINKIYFNSLFISHAILAILIVLLSSLGTIDFNSELTNYISTLLFVVFIYYIFGNDYSNKTYETKTLKDFYAYTYSIIAKDYNLYFIRSLIFIFYTFVLIFGQLRDLGIHNSGLFKYEQYAIVLIIAIDRIVNTFTKDFSRVKEHMRRKKDSEKEVFIKIMEDNLKEIRVQFELLLKINPEYDIDNLDLWENASDSEHPQTKLLCLYILFKLGSNDSDRVDELFILTGKSVKQSCEAGRLPA